ncbi:MAG: F0F1 ATP synthase subunit delta [Candidatus Saccharimonadaceae bacterium]|nr:F0F1 ATP synthase subunit delta [Candidatus Saccharimonadaceae bacterium]
MKFKLPDSLSSPQDLTDLLLEIKEYSKWKSHNDILKRAGSKRTTKPPEISKTAGEVINGWSKDKSLDKNGLDSLIETLNSYSVKAPRINITLAAPPSGELRKKLVGWCRNNITPNILVTFDFNKTILGGIVLRSGSKIYDWSFKKQIMASRDKFVEEINRV